MKIILLTNIIILININFLVAKEQRTSEVIEIKKTLTLIKNSIRNILIQNDEHSKSISIQINESLRLDLNNDLNNDFFPLRLVYDVTKKQNKKNNDEIDELNGINYIDDNCDGLIDR